MSLEGSWERRLRWELHLEHCRCSVIPLSLLHDPLGFLTSLPSHGDLVRIQIGPFETIVVCTPELVRQVLLDDCIFDKTGPVFDRARDALGDGLATWPARFPGYAQVMSKHIAEVTASWQHGQILDVLSEMMTLTTRIAVETMFSDELSSAVLQAVFNDFRTILAGIYTRTIVPPPLDKFLIVGNRRFNLASVPRDNPATNLPVEGVECRGPVRRSAWASLGSRRMHERLPAGSMR